MSGFPAPPRRVRSRLWLALTALVLATALAVTAVAVFVPSRTVPGSATPGFTAPLTAPTTEVEDEAWKVVPAKDGDSEISVPESWTQLPDDFQGDEFLIAQAHAFREHYVGVLSHHKGDIASFETLVDFAEEQMDAFENFQLKDKRRMRIGGMTAVRFHFTGEYEGINAAVWMALVNGRKAYYGVAAWTLKSREATAGPVLRKVIDSFRETAGGGD